MDLLAGVKRVCRDLGFSKHFSIGLNISLEGKTMIFSSDSFYMIGNGHTYCQDYACHGSYGNYCWGIVSDGCSGADNSDIGARFLVLKTNAVIKQMLVQSKHDILHPSFYHVVMDQVMLDYGDLIGMLGCQGIIKHLDLPLDVMQATLWMVIGQKVSDKFRFSVFGYGDGQCVMKDKDGIVIKYITFPSGAPFYPVYAYNPSIENDYIKQFGTEKVKGEYIVGLDKNFKSSEVKELYREPFFEAYEIGKQQFQSATVCTDGFRTYSNSNENDFESMRWSSNRLVDLQSYEGVFLQRRIKALARRDLKDKIGHFDDLGAAGVLMMEKSPDEVQDGK